MRICMFILAAWLFAAGSAAQETASTSEEGAVPAEVMEADTLGTFLMYPVADGMFSMYGLAPYGCGYATWELHEGFNASVGLSVTFSPGSSVLSGAGFGQDAAFMYAVPLTDRLSVAGGIYASNFSWGPVSRRDVGFAGVAAFKVNERISLYAYGNKTFMPQRSQSRYTLPGFAPDRVGGMVNFKLGTSSSFSIGLEGIWGPDGRGR